MQILETFLEMSTTLRNEIPIYLHMCISYSAVVIAQYWHDTPPAARASSASVVELLTALEDWCATCQPALVTSYSAGLAKRRIQASAGAYAAKSSQEGPPQRGDVDVAAGSPLYSAAEGLLGLGGVSLPDNDRPPNLNNHMLDMQDLGIDLTPDFPSMEDFFGGGFIDFMR